MKNEHGKKEIKKVEMSCLDIINIEGLAQTPSKLDTKKCWGHFKLTHHKNLFEDLFEVNEVECIPMENAYDFEPCEDGFKTVTDKTTLQNGVKVVK